MNRVSFIVLYLLCVRVLCAQTSLVLPYDATALTDEQKASNPERLAYPTELKETIKSQVSFECNTEILDLGPFSVSEKKTVFFSPGNLQYQPSTKTWRFAEHQWEVIGEGNNLNIPIPSASWIDLFGWGTGNNPTLSSTDDNDFSTFMEWGVNAISNGGNEANMWRTLTNEEWEFLIKERPNAKALYGLGHANERFGLILLPDDWTLPAGLSFTGKNDTYTSDEWSVMEAAGAVFLPAAGYRYCDGGVDYVGSIGYYWSSTPYSSESAWRLYFVSGKVSMYRSNRCYGYSVRLVR